MQLIKRLTAVGIVTAGALLLILAMTDTPAAAQANTVQITSAVLSIYETNVTSETVYAHPISVTWNETAVTWQTFTASYRPEVLGSFVADSIGWHSITLTEQVQAWVNNPAQNFGVAFEQGDTNFTTYYSGESPLEDQRPKLDVCYIRGSNPETCITIQRTEDSPSLVRDAYVWAQVLDYNGGSSSTLYTGLYEDGVKVMLLRFELAFAPTAVALQSLGAHTASAPSSGILLLATFGLIGLAAIWRKRGR